MINNSVSSYADEQDAIILAGKRRRNEKSTLSIYLCESLYRDG